MKCTMAQRLMSEYHDGELSPGVRSEVSCHLERCGSCSRQLAMFGHISQLASQLSDPSPPVELWGRIQCLLRHPSNRPKIGIVRRVVKFCRVGSRLSLAAQVAITATVLLATTGLLLVARGGLHNVEQRRVAADFDHYLTYFDQSPEIAQRFLSHSYDGRTVSLNEAATLVRYQPAARHVPVGYSGHEVNILKMPCCSCVQVIWKHVDGRWLAIFEHDREQTFWSGNRPTISTDCGGTPIRLFQLEKMIAATWESSQPRHLTLIGARDIEELLFLVTHFESRS